MKSGREHRVPLSKEAIALLTALPRERTSDFVFIGSATGRPLGNVAMLRLLQVRMGYADLSVHGFRSTFRDWAAEQTNFPREVAELALAHSIGDKVEAAYRRGDLFAKRTKLMLAWGAFAYAPKGPVGRNGRG
jgi:integrase